MPFQRPQRQSSVLVNVMAAGLMLAVGGCSHITPLGPDSTPTMPPQRHLGSPLIVQVMRSRPITASGKCPAGYLALSAPGYAGACYRSLGTPVRITSAAISSVSTYRPPPGQPKGPSSYGFMIAVPVADVAAVTAVIRKAYDSRAAVGISVAGKLWEAPSVDSPFSGKQLQVSLFSRNQALQLYRILVPST
jgi:hypothetical protein